MSISYGFVSTHPPTECGIATFNQALAAQFDSAGVVRVVEREEAISPETLIVHNWASSDAGGWQLAAKALGQFDVAVVQHEYGIYPGADGGDVIPLLRQLTTPSIVVMHTVLASPTPSQKSVLEQVAQAAGAVVVMTGTARERLINTYGVDPAKITVIPHGAIDHASQPVEKTAQPHLLTWGLLGPGKGIEWAIRALGRVRGLHPRPIYTVAGKTHPRVVERSGEEYRDGLRRLTSVLGLSDVVRFDPVYRDDLSLSRLIRSADVVLLPYDSREQVTSGVLNEAVAAGIPVVATPFPHAVELLTDGPGILVPYADPVAMAAAIREIVTKPSVAAGLSVAPKAPASLWRDVAGQYAALAQRLLVTSEHRAAVPA